MSQPNAAPWRKFLEIAGLYSSWLWLAALGVIAGFQLHATSIFIALQLVRLQAVNEIGWNTSTIHGLSRFLYLVLGIAWLFSVMVLDGYLREAQRQRKLLNRTLRLSLAIAALYAFTYLLLLLMS